MTYSMTAFTRKTLESEWGSITWELRSVNHRFLDIYLRLPDFLRDQEKVIREQIQQKIKRGKLEASLIFNPSQNQSSDFSLNQALLNKLAQVIHQVEKLIPQANVEYWKY